MSKKIEESKKETDRSNSDVKGNSTFTNQIALPSLSLPKGGGAIRGLGEKFGTNPVTGTASLTIPLPLTSGRSGFGPQLTLSYDSGAGNGPFGFGWTLSLPSISRKTDKGLPRYRDSISSAEYQEDIFLISGAEDLVPVYKRDLNGKWVIDKYGKMVIEEEPYNGYLVRRYRPRTEGLFSLIERWTRISDGDIHWRTISIDNILTVYGKDEESRISDPKDEKGRVFSWLICQSFDDKGNAIVYEYAPENDTGLDLSKTNERNRSRTSNRYLKRILYGNRLPLLLDITKTSFRKAHTDPLNLSSAGWMFEAVFDYGDDFYEHVQPDSTIPLTDQHELIQACAPPTSAWPNGSARWPSRPDAFSTFRSGFEIRTYRRCKRVLMFHRFPELFPGVGTQPYLVRSTEFNYLDFDYPTNFTVRNELEHGGSTRFASFIYSVTQSGYVRDSSKPAQQIKIGGVTYRYYTYIKKSLPPLELKYSKAKIQDNEIIEVESESLENVPYGTDGNRYQFVDLNGEGISGILSEQGGDWFYKPNLSHGKFGPLENISLKPSLANLGGNDQQLLDLTGDGNLDLIDMNGTTKGYYERIPDKRWKNFTPFLSLPNISLKDPNLRFIDLTGDGHSDILITEEQALIWYPSVAEKGFGVSEKVIQTLDEEKGPRLIFADGTQSIYLADMSGDGLSDLVRIRNGEICYWPNMGYGHFGEKVSMDNAPLFDISDQFDQKRIRLADIDGSGVTDIAYLHSDGVKIYFNQSGNMWSSPYVLSNFPRIDNHSSVQIADLLGNGTACLIWSSPLSESRRPMRYIDLMGGKPHLLINLKNNFGAETRISYASSTKFYLADKIAGNPWITRLPFPVHVVERIITCDYIGRNYFVKRYAYHHGYFDGVEREFRGFGMVEEWDTEEMDSHELDTRNSHLDSNWNIHSFVPPVLTRTWFHTGYYYDEEKITKLFAKEYYHGSDPGSTQAEIEFDFRSKLLPDTVFETDIPGELELSLQEMREACRSLKGSILHQEVYALDSDKDGNLTEESERPYTVSERNYTVKRLQPKGENKHGIYIVNPRETVDYYYERKLYDVLIGGHIKKQTDPRIKHNVIIKTDEFGNVLKSIEINYGRKHSDLTLTDLAQTTQETPLTTYHENSYTLALRFPDAYRAPLLSEAQVFELVKINSINSNSGIDRFSFNQLNTLVEKPEFSRGDWDILYSDIEYSQAIDDHVYRRPIEQTRTKYRSNKLDRLLPVGAADLLALAGETYRLAFTKDLLDEVYSFERRGQQPEKLLEKHFPADPTLVLTSKKSDGCGYVDLDNDKKKWWVPSGKIYYSPNSSDDSVKELDYASKHFFLPHRFCDQFDNNSFVAYDGNEVVPEKNHNLLPIRIQDPVDNIISVHNNYRVLQPEVSTDPNGTKTEVLFDAIGLVVATSIYKGTEGDSVNNVQADLTRNTVDDFFANPLNTAVLLIGTASSRIIYDIDSYFLTRNPDNPPYSATIMRETHASDTPAGDFKVQVNFSYSDGFRREIQKKVQAEPGKVNDIDVTNRWVGSGWTIFNNKGKPVRKYEPFFNDTHTFKYGKQIGVSAVLFYDPIGRTVTTLYPNNTFEKIVFDPWQQKVYDANDTVLLDPRNDKDVFGYVSRYFSDLDYTSLTTWKTWYALRIDGTFGADTEQRKAEKDAAHKTAAHKDTPTTMHFDALGRTFMTVADNGIDQVGKSQLYSSLVKLDIEDNQREVRDSVILNGDAQGRIVVRYDYDMLGNEVRQQSIDAGVQWVLNDVTEKPVLQWKNPPRKELDPLQKFEIEYDTLRRAVRSFVKGFNPTDFTQKILFERTIYGEQHPDAKARNLRGKIFLLCDTGGVIKYERFDYDGNLLQSSRRLVKGYQKSANWTSVDSVIPKDPRTYLTLTSLNSAISSQTESEIDHANAIFYSTKTLYDALKRPIQIIAPHSSEIATKINIIQPVYNDANLLESESVWLEQTSEPNGMLDPSSRSLHCIKNIDYNAKGQREYVEYGMEDGNRVWSTYEYDVNTFRLTHLQTRRKRSDHTAEEFLQDLYYFYDPVGNIIQIRDDAHQTIFFRRQRVKPSCEYTYDALYRLIEATGREHLGQAESTPPPYSYNDRLRIRLNHPGDGKAVGKYMEQYVYDAVGNIRSIRHYSSDSSHPAWSRTYEYDEDSIIEPSSATHSGKKSNRLTRSTVKGTNPVTENYLHDAHGNIIQMPQLQIMQWNHNDQLQMTQRQKINDADEDGVERQGERTYYVYDASGQRIRKATNLPNGNLKDERIYLSGFEIYRQHSGSNSGLVRESLHIMDDKHRIAIVEMRNDVEDGTSQLLVRYQLSNHLHSAGVELDRHAQIISYEEYTPYGATSFQGVRSQTETPKEYRYVGKERDEETGLYYYGARFYAPWLGRWISSDPAGIIDSMNSFAYTKNNPVVYFDQDGKSSVKAITKDIAEQFVKEFGKKESRLMEEKILSRTLGHIKKGNKLEKAMEHIGEHFHPDKSKPKHTMFTEKFRDKEKVLELIKDAVANPSYKPILSRGTHEGQQVKDFVFIIEKEFPEEIGEVIKKEGKFPTKKMAVIVDKSGRLVSAYPVERFIRTSISGAATSFQVAMAIFTSLTIEWALQDEQKKVQSDLEATQEKHEGGILNYFMPLLLDTSFSHSGFLPAEIYSEEYVKERAESVVSKIKSDLAKNDITLTEVEVKNLKRDVATMYHRPEIYGRQEG